MACPPQVPISIIPPVSKGVSPILWQNGNQITRLNIPTNPSWLVYDGANTTWADGSTTSPIYLPNVFQATSIPYVLGISQSGQLQKADPLSLIVNSAQNIFGGSAGRVPYQTGAGTTSFTDVGSVGQVLTSNGTGSPTWASAPAATTANNIIGGIASQLVYQSSPSTTEFLPNGNAGQVLVSNGSFAPSWSTNILGNASTATTATIANGVSAGAVTPSGLSAAVGANAWLSKTSSYTALAGDRIAASTTGGAWTLTLPTSPATNSIVTIADTGNAWATNNLTIAPGGANTIQGVVQNLICNISGYSFYLLYDGSTWRVLV